MAKEKRQHPQTGWFDKLSTGRKDLFSVLFLLALVVVLFHKIIFNNMVFSSVNDTASAQSWVHAGNYLEEAEHEEVLWMPYVFSGMPAFASLSYGTPFKIPLIGIAAPHSSPVSPLQGILHILGKWFFLNAEDGWLVLHYFLSGLFMFLLARRWGLG